MALGNYLEIDLNIGSLVDPVDTFIGTGSQVTFSLVNKPGARLSSTIQAESVIYPQYAGGFIKSGNTFTLSSAPPLNAQIVAPGISQITVSVFDQPVVEGVTNPLSGIAKFYLADPNTIHLYQYINLPQYTGIRVTLSDLISSTGAQLSWCQLGSSNAAGTLTFAATGQDLFLPSLSAFGTISASSAAGSNTLFVTGASTFLPDQLIRLNIGTGTAEIRQIQSIAASGNFVLSTNTDFAHYIGETVYACGWGLGIQVTVPSNVTNNTAANFYDIGVRRMGRIQSRT